MDWNDIDLRPCHRALRQFAAAWLLVFAVLGLNQWLFRDHPRGGIALLIVALLVGGMGLLRPQSVRWVFVACTVAAFPIGWAVSQLMLVILFGVIITPVALLFKAGGRDRLWRKRTTERSTYWKPRAAIRDVGRYLRQY